MRHYKPMLRVVSHFSKFYDFAIIDYFAIFANFAKSFGHFMRVDKIYPHAKFGGNISIQYRVMAQNRFRPYMAVSRPSWIGQLRKNNSAVHFEVLNIILQFQLNPSSGSSVIAGEKPLRTDRRTDRTETYSYRGRKKRYGRTDGQKDGRTDGQDKNIYASSPLGGGIIKII